MFRGLRCYNRPGHNWLGYHPSRNGCQRRVWETYTFPRVISLSDGMILMMIDCMWFRCFFLFILLGEDAVSQLTCTSFQVAICWAALFENGCRSWHDHLPWSLVTKNHPFLELPSLYAKYPARTRMRKCLLDDFNPRIQCFGPGMNPRIQRVEK